MADVKISDLPSLSQASLDAATDVLPIVDTSLNITSKITANAVVKNVLQNPGPIGAGTPDTGAFTTLSSSGGITGDLTGNVSGSLSGNASTASVLQTARNINGTSFNGSADITVTAAAGTLTGATLTAGVTASSLTSVGTLSSLNVSGAVTAASISFGQDALNYYDEGTWTPTLKFSTIGDLSVGYSSQIGAYTRIGRQVTVHGRVEGFLTYTTASGAFYIDGLPFSPDATQRYFVGVCTKAGFTAPNAGGVVVRTDPNIFPNGLYIEYQTTTSASPFTNTQVTTGSTATLIFTITYFV